MTANLRGQPELTGERDQLTGNAVGDKRLMPTIKQSRSQALTLQALARRKTFRRRMMMLIRDTERRTTIEDLERQPLDAEGRDRQVERAKIQERCPPVACYLRRAVVLEEAA